MEAKSQGSKGGSQTGSRVEAAAITKEFSDVKLERLDRAASHHCHESDMHLWGLLLLILGYSSLADFIEGNTTSSSSYS